MFTWTRASELAAQRDPQKAAFEHALAAGLTTLQGAQPTGTGWYGGVSPYNPTCMAGGHICSPSHPTNCVPTGGNGGGNGGGGSGTGGGGSAPHPT